MVSKILKQNGWVAKASARSEKPHSGYSSDKDTRQEETGYYPVSRFLGPVGRMPVVGMPRIRDSL